MPNGCLEWTWYKTRHGYGQMHYGGVVKFTHRLAYELKHGPIPRGMHVCHTCDNPPCCNPDHLFLGSQTDNMTDKTNKNRQAQSLQLPQTVLTDQNVRDIRTSSNSAKELAKQYNVTVAHIRDIIAKRRRKNI